MTKMAGTKANPDKTEASIVPLGVSMDTASNDGTAQVCGAALFSNFYHPTRLRTKSSVRARAMSDPNRFPGNDKVMGESGEGSSPRSPSPRSSESLTTTTKCHKPRGFVNASALRKSSTFNCNFSPFY